MFEYDIMCLYEKKNNETSKQNYLNTLIVTVLISIMCKGNVFKCIVNNNIVTESEEFKFS